MDGVNLSAAVDAAIEARRFKPEPLVERLAREAGFVQGNKPEQLLWSHHFGGWLEIRELRRFAAVVAEECAREADEEEQIRSKAGKEHPEESESRSRCFAGARAAANVGRCIRAKFPAMK